MKSTQLTSTVHLDYGLDTPFGRITKSAECQVGLEQVEHDPTRFALRVQPPIPQDLEQAKTVLVKVDGRRLNGIIRHTERLEDQSLKLEVEPE
ncbi:hypothetical protein [Pseudomonas svalbardensis]|uniref:hypothetical protein n=1 Tax=Pseudomonas svalbardensis TaxID=3042029 RepID=UPI0024B36B57|nr:hypothetical protein [Pseudomonas sp. PMCC200367]